MLRERGRLAETEIDTKTERETGRDRLTQTQKGRLAQKQRGRLADKDGHKNTEGDWQRQRRTQKQRRRLAETETLFYKDCSVGFSQNLKTSLC